MTVVPVVAAHASHALAGHELRRRAATLSRRFPTPLFSAAGSSWLGADVSERREEYATEAYP